MGLPHGPDSSGEGANYLEAGESAPPARRSSEIRGVLDALSPPGLVGCAQSMDTDASLGYRRMGYRKSEEAFARCGA